MTCVFQHIRGHIGHFGAEEDCSNRPGYGILNEDFLQKRKNGKIQKRGAFDIWA
jgi:hypothetical protein